MKRLSMVLAVMLVLGAGSVFAQDVPKVEVFGGGAIMNVREGGGELTLKGWTGSVNANVHDVVGVVGEIGGNYKSGFKVHNFLGGLQFSHRGNEKVAVFAQTKAGFVHSSGSGSSENDFMLGFGGGLDLNVKPNLAVRLFQIDWTPVREGGGSGWLTNVFRGSIGLTWKSASR